MSELLISKERAKPAAEKNNTTHWFHNKWSTLGIFTALSMACSIDRFVLGALLTPIKTSLLLTDEQLGRLNVAFTLSTILVYPIFGYLGDHFRRKWLILFGLVLWSFATVGSGLATGLTVLLVWRFLVGLGEGAFYSLAPSWVTDTFERKIRSAAYAVFHSPGQIGAMIALVVGAAIAAKYGWQSAFFVAGIPGFFLAIILIFVKEPTPGASDGHRVAPPKVSLRDSGALFKNTDYQIFLAAYSFHMFSLAGLFFWGPVYLHRQFDVTNVVASSAFGSGFLYAGAPGVYIGGILAGWLFRKTYAGYSLWLLFGEALAGVMLVIALGAGSFDVARNAIWLEMFFAASCTTIAIPLLFETVPVNLRNTALAGASVVSQGITSIFASQGIGWLSDHHGLHQALYLLPAGYFASSALWIVLAYRQWRHKAPHFSVHGAEALAVAE